MRASALRGRHELSDGRNKTVILNRLPHRRLLALSATVLLATALVAGCGSSASSSSADSATATDKAFVRQMVPHHQLAVQMAKMAQTQGQHPQTKQLANDIVRTQNSEIAQMTSISKTLGVKPAVAMHGMDMHSPDMAGDAKTLGLQMDAMGMSMNMDMLDGAKPFDRAFIDMMVPHHQGAVRMANAELATGKNPDLRKLAKGIIAAQAKEIREMNQWRQRWYGSLSPNGGVPKA